MWELKVDHETAKVTLTNPQGESLDLQKTLKGIEFKEGIQPSGQILLTLSARKVRFVVEPKKPVETSKRPDIKDANQTDLKRGLSPVPVTGDSI